MYDIEVDAQEVNVQTEKSIKYAQIDIVPFIEKYQLPMWLVVVVIILMLMKQLNILYFLKDFWDGLKNIFNSKNKKILELEGQLKECEIMMEKMQKKIKQLEIKVAMFKPLIQYLKDTGVNSLGLDKILNEVEDGEDNCKVL